MSTAEERAGDCGSDVMTIAGLPAGVVLAQADAEPSLFGWYLGLAIGFAVVLVVVIIVSAILTLTAKIRDQAGDATDALYDAQAKSLALWDIRETNRLAQGILESARRARKAVEG